MFEKVNPCHPDKIADRIAGAITDLAYTKEENPRVATEVLIGHGLCTIITEASVLIENAEVSEIVERIAGEGIETRFIFSPQDIHLSANQNGRIRCGDNGIFKGAPVTVEQSLLSEVARRIYSAFPYDGKYLVHNGRMIICQSNCEQQNDIVKEIKDITTLHTLVINPIGSWTGGTNVDTGATNRKLGSDMADSVTGGGLHGKDLSKADVSVNIYAWLKAQKTRQFVEMSCAIGDETVCGVPYEEIVSVARRYIRNIGGFEKFAEWGLV